MHFAPRRHSVVKSLWVLQQTICSSVLVRLADEQQCWSWFPLFQIPVEGVESA